MPEVYYGQNSSFSIISKTHGKVEMGFNEQFDVDVSLANKRLYFFNKKEALSLSVFEGVSGRFGYLETEEKYYQAAVMDVTPSSTMLNDDPSAYQEFGILLNCKNEAGTINNAIYVKGCRITSSPASMTPREEQHSTCSYIGATRFIIKGGGIKYTRFVGSAPAYRTTDDVTISGTGPISGTLTASATAVNIENSSTTRTYLAVYRNGTDVTKDTAYITGFSVSGTQVVFPSGTFGTTDVWETFTPYKP